LQTLS